MGEKRFDKHKKEGLDSLPADSSPLSCTRARPYLHYGRRINLCKGLDVKRPPITLPSASAAGRAIAHAGAARLGSGSRHHEARRPPRTLPRLLRQSSAALPRHGRSIPQRMPGRLGKARPTTTETALRPLQSAHERIYSQARWPRVRPMRQASDALNQSLKQSQASPVDSGYMVAGRLSSSGR